MVIDKIKNSLGWSILSEWLSIGVIVLDRNYRIINFRFTKGRGRFSIFCEAITIWLTILYKNV